MTREGNPPTIWNWALRICVSLTLLSRGWLLFRWDSPIRALIWHEEFWAPVIQSRGTTWSEFANRSDAWITSGIEWLGIILMLGALLPLIIQSTHPKKLRWLLLPLTAILALDTIGRWVEHEFETGMLLEYGLQLGCPILLLFMLHRPALGTHWSIIAGLFTACTFIGHGLYAANVYPLPLIFQTMTMSILHLSESASVRLLFAAGILDFIVTLGLLFAKTRIPALIYMVIWGALTSMARIVAHADIDADAYGFDPWLAETLVRTSHWMIPLLLIFRCRRKPLA